MRRTAGFVPVALLLSAACATAPPAVPLSAADAEPWAARWETRRAAAYGPRRLKALYKGEAAPKVGVIARGYLSVWWDGVALVWKASAPLAGDLRGGTLSAASGGDSPLPGRLKAGDAIGALLGVLDVPAEGRPVERVGDAVRIRLDAEGREAVFGKDGRLTGLKFPDGTRIVLEPASPLPLRLDAAGPGGTASLVLQNWADWPEGEAIPGGRA